MPTLTNELITEIRNRTDIVDVISKYSPLTKKGKNYFGVCPFHDDHSPSMSVSPEKQIYTCFSCGATGNVFTFVADYEHISFIEAVNLLGSKLGYNITNSSQANTRPKNPGYEICSLASKFYQNNLNTALGKNALDYLEKERKFDRETIKKFELGLSIPKLSLTEFLLSKNIALDKLINLGLTNNYSKDIFQNRIMFPLHDLSGNIVGFSGRIYNTQDNSKYINTKETELFKKNNLMYNYHQAREYLKKNDTIIVMEGFFDAIRATTAGVNNVVATMGTAFTKNHAHLLKKITDNIILCFDGDQAGEDATIAAIKILEEIQVTPQIIRLEEKDPDEYILKHGAEAFLNKIKKPLTTVEFKMQLFKQNKNLTDVNDISKYIEETIKELIKINDEVAIELTIKKLSKEFNLKYETIKQKYDNYKKNQTIKEPKSVIIKKAPIKHTKYDIASNYLLFHMLKNEDLIPKIENQITRIPNDETRFLYNELIYYYQKYGTLKIADFISYISDKKEIFLKLQEILNIDYKEEYSEEEITDYIQVINEYNKNIKIQRLQQDIKKEQDPMKQAQILKEIMEIKGVKA